jgi:hypothetical protein
MGSFKAFAFLRPLSVLCVVAMSAASLVGVALPKSASAQVQTTRVAETNNTSLGKAVAQVSTATANALNAVAMVGAPPEVPTVDGSGVLVVWDNPQSISAADIVDFSVQGGDSLFSLTPYSCAVPWIGPLGMFGHSLVDSGTPGVTQTWYVSCDYLQDTAAGTSTVEIGPVFAGTCTVLSRPLLLSPGDVGSQSVVDLTNASFQWHGSRGADTYVIEIAPTTSFLRSQTMVVGRLSMPTVVDGQVMQWPAAGAMNVFTSTGVYNASSLQSWILYNPDTPLYWRVGARSSLDNPGPYPAGDSIAGAWALSGPESTRFIYTSRADYFSFLPNASGMSPVLALAGRGIGGRICYSTDLSKWTQMPKSLSDLVIGSFTGSGSYGLAGLDSNDSIWYTTDLENWTKIPGQLKSLVAGAFNGTSQEGLAGLGKDGSIWYTTDFENWTNVPGFLNTLTTGNFAGTGCCRLAGTSSDNGIWVSQDLSTWSNIPGQLTTIVTGDFNGGGNDGIAGLATDGSIWYTADLADWNNIPGQLSSLVAGDFNGDGKADIAGLASDGSIWYTTDLATWNNIPGHLTSLTVGDFNGGAGDDLAGLASDGTVWYTTDLQHWINIPGQLSTLVSAGTQ